MDFDKGYGPEEFANEPDYTAPIAESVTFEEPVPAAPQVEILDPALISQAAALYAQNVVMGLNMVFMRAKWEPVTQQEHEMWTANFENLIKVHPKLANMGRVMVYLSFASLPVTMCVARASSAALPTNTPAQPQRPAQETDNHSGIG